MKRKLFVFIISYFIINLPFVSYAKDELWQKAVKLTEKSRNLKAKELNTTIYELNKDQSIKDTRIIYQRLHGKKDYKTYKIIKNGIDISSTEIPKSEKRKRKLSFEDNIFLEEFQNKLNIEKLEKEKINNQDSILYKFIYEKSEKEKWVGKAWLNPVTANPIKISFTINPYPTGVRNLIIDYYYSFDGEKVLLDNIEINTQVNLLIFDKYIKVKTDLKNYIN